MSKSLPPGVVLESVDCPNGCLAKDDLVLNGSDLLHHIPGEFSIYRCRHCGLERTTPRPTPDSIGVYYPADYGPYQPEAITGTGSKKVAKNWLRGILGLRSRTLPPVLPGRMLEVGCSTGNYMEEARSAGWDVEGIEFSSDAAAVARSKGFAVHIGAIEQVESFRRDYDVITAWMVLEHLHEPVTALRKLRSWIKPGGYLVALVPSAESLSRTMFGARSYDLQLPTHLYHYTPKTIGILLDKAGWRLERVFWQRNCMTILHSFEIWANERKNSKLAMLARWIRIGKLSIPIRILLNLLLGLMRQSGRIEIWARPINTLE
jgi:SAM-dependent methyltransferase